MENQAESNQFEQSVRQLFDSIEKEYPGVAEGMRALNMSYTDYLTILQNAQVPTSFSANGTVMTIDK
jgi:hypothetical protein